MSKDCQTEFLKRLFCYNNQIALYFSELNYIKKTILNFYITL